MVLSVSSKADITRPEKLRLSQSGRTQSMCLRSTLIMYVNAYLMHALAYLHHACSSTRKALNLRNVAQGEAQAPSKLGGVRWHACIRRSKKRRANAEGDELTIPALLESSMPGSMSAVKSCRCQSNVGKAATSALHRQCMFLEDVMSLQNLGCWFHTITWLSASSDTCLPTQAAF